MLRLILMRHAKSDWSHQGLSDHQRPLNKRGTASARALGGWLRAGSYLPGQVLSSSSERTGQTCTGLDLPQSVAITFTRALYLADAEKMMEVLRGATAPCVLMLGHNPGIADMAHRLVTAPVDHERFMDYPTGATLVVDFDAAGWNDIGWHEGQPIDFIIPRDLS
ncbi:histidine phosphatase family protein [Roseobacter sp. YSTF-M11]|uniref:Histidine phosphatase family protein n=1 Tax=Roseobacter insulae TaxID=2859783 RepID=A0A9X1JZY1_9RHOB|nr:histidine phosphatase family protein [Roseobacter insulae]MBW4709876.1 histidine phosphatase family protein [Roseobacter insulae]